MKYRQLGKNAFKIVAYLGKSELNLMGNFQIHKKYVYFFQIIIFIYFIIVVQTAHTDFTRI
jgi:hypothetical protein